MFVRRPQIVQIRCAEPPANEGVNANRRRRLPGDAGVEGQILVAAGRIDDAQAPALVIEISVRKRLDIDMCEPATEIRANRAKTGASHEFDDILDEQSTRPVSNPFGEALASRQSTPSRDPLPFAGRRPARRKSRRRRRWHDGSGMETGLHAVPERIDGDLSCTMRSVTRRPWRTDPSRWAFIEKVPVTQSNKPTPIFGSAHRRTEVVARIGAQAAEPPQRNL